MNKEQTLRVIKESAKENIALYLGDWSASYITTYANNVYENRCEGDISRDEQLGITIEDYIEQSRDAFRQVVSCFQSEVYDLALDEVEGLEHVKIYYNIDKKDYEVHKFSSPHYDLIDQEGLVFLASFQQTLEGVLEDGEEALRENLYHEVYENLVKNNL